jgi:hypothetical protein
MYGYSVVCIRVATFWGVMRRVTVDAFRNRVRVETVSYFERNYHEISTDNVAVSALNCSTVEITSRGRRRFRNTSSRVSRSWAIPRSSVSTAATHYIDAPQAQKFPLENWKVVFWRWATSSV